MLNKHRFKPRLLSCVVLSVFLLSVTVVCVSVSRVDARSRRLAQGCLVTGRQIPITV